MRIFLTRTLLAGGIAVAALFGTDVVPSQGSGESRITVSGSTAEAGPRERRRAARRKVRRTARRTARRVERRNDYLRSLPGGCVWRAPYHYCRGIYYRPAVVDGVNVFIIVTP